MGLKDYKLFKKQQEFLEVLSLYGLTKEDLANLKKVSSLEEENKRLALEIESLKNQLKAKSVVDEEIVKKNKQNSEGKMTPEEFVNLFAGDVEEYYPNGKEQ